MRLLVCVYVFVSLCVCVCLSVCMHLCERGREWGWESVEEFLCAFYNPIILQSAVVRPQVVWILTDSIPPPASLHYSLGRDTVWLIASISLPFPPSSSTPPLLMPTTYSITPDLITYLKCDVEGQMATYSPKEIYSGPASNAEEIPMTQFVWNL